ncbi:glycosyltransferase family 2 protein [Micrococcus luteus]|uniref:glycosyltransferase family 2 protein n=1 Tax=Micrococcus luteus TaxID=1270 RepID=UPI001364ACE3|nr:glycosyltransferase family A protein [Micrococcus luteus]
MVSVIIPAFNAERVLGLQLDSLADQGGAPAYEVLVVDNNSTDGTADLVRDRTSAFPVPLRLIRAAEHQGPGYARNVGVARARADLLLFADADDVVSRWWVRNGARAFSVTPLWSGGAQLMSNTDMTGGLEDIRAAMGDTADWTDVVPGNFRDAFPVVMGGDFGATRDVYTRVGGFDISLGGVYEDNDFGVRAHRLGIAVDEAPAVRIAFRGKWDLRFRTRLARRSAYAHALVADRYGLNARSHFPNPWRELARATGSAALMAAGHKPRDWPGVWMRLNTAAGHAWGKAEAHVPWKRRPASALGVGMASVRQEEERA